MGRYNDLTGRVFESLTVLRRAPNDRNNNTRWVCQCLCGSPEKEIDAYQITSGHTVSCGCYHDQLIGNRVRTHGMCRTREYVAWCGMKNRCTNAKERQWMDYGGRGITIAPEFQTFEGFIAHLGPCPPRFTLDRIDVDGNYAPGNVRWASRLTQGRNTRRVRPITFNGESLLSGQWAARIGVSRKTLDSRLETGWTVEEALTAPPNSRLRDIREAANNIKRLSLKEKNRAQDKVQRAVRRGKIQKLTCAVCGSRQSEAHHTDYSQPLLVVWLCRKHHMAEHLNSRSAA
jgi:hypothetical protein